MRLELLDFLFRRCSVGRLSAVGDGDDVEGFVSEDGGDCEKVEVEYGGDAM